MRVTKIEVCDFRGFPGPAVYDFEFGGARNLLIFGENGSGKSSLFRAIQEFFNRSRRAKPFSSFKNIDDPTLAAGNVIVQFENGSVQRWDYGSSRPNLPPASQTALQVGCLDYRSLLETNFSHKGDTVNLFEIAVNHLVDRMEVPVSGGGSERIGDLWNNVLASMPTANRRRSVERSLAAIERFNGAFAPVLTPLMERASILLSKFPGCDFELSVSFHPVEYDPKPKRFRNLELILSVTRRGQVLPNHHDFLNEAKLSAIGLVIYLAGLLNTVPPSSNYPKLLVLDDVLIGLEMANRKPILDLLAEYFADWQVILMTHDKVWYEMVQLQLDGNANWNGYELYVGANEAPVHYQRGTGAAYFLDRARQHLAVNDAPGAANYTRSAFEWKIKSYCDEESTPVPYKKNPDSISSHSLWTAAKKRAIEKAADPRQTSLKQRFADIDTWKKIVLNPLSHSSGASVTRHEVQMAIDAVAKLAFK